MKKNEKKVRKNEKRRKKHLINTIGTSEVGGMAEVTVIQTVEAAMEAVENSGIKDKAKLQRIFI